jgi:sugar lactone lactonase YvrE
MFYVNHGLRLLSYRFNVAADGTFDNRKVFAYVDSGLPDGMTKPTGLSSSYRACCSS